MRQAAFDLDRFARDLRLRITALGVTQRQAASEAGVSPSGITRILNGYRPDVDGLAALCAWAGLSADDYISRDPDAQPPTTRDGYAEVRARLEEALDALDRLIITAPASGESR